MSDSDQMTSATSQRSVISRTDNNHKQSTAAALRNVDALTLASGDTSALDSGRRNRTLQSLDLASSTKPSTPLRSSSKPLTSSSSSKPEDDTIDYKTERAIRDREDASFAQRISRWDSVMTSQQNASNVMKFNGYTPTARPVKSAMRKTTTSNSSSQGLGFIANKPGRHIVWKENLLFDLQSEEALGPTWDGKLRSLEGTDILHQRDTRGKASHVSDRTDQVLKAMGDDLIESIVQGAAVIPVSGASLDEDYELVHQYGVMGTSNGGVPSDQQDRHNEEVKDLLLYHRLPKEVFSRLYPAMSEAPTSEIAKSRGIASEWGAEYFRAQQNAHKLLLSSDDRETVCSYIEGLEPCMTMTQKGKQLKKEREQIQMFLESKDEPTLEGCTDADCQKGWCQIHGEYGKRGTPKHKWSVAETYGPFEGTLPTEESEESEESESYQEMDLFQSAQKLHGSRASLGSEESLPASVESSHSSITVEQSAVTVF